MSPGGGCGYEYVTFICQNKKDECYSDSDCAGEVCVIRDGGTECIESNLACGRPFLVDHKQRLAPAVERADWKASTKENRRAVLTSDRERAAEHFTLLALLEHASIAAFARFTLQLLALGAPAKLIEGCHDAMRDETEHARAAFSLASHWGGSPLGPGPLETDGLSTTFGVEEILLDTILEGCIGATTAALEARCALRECLDEEARAFYERVATDEANHAQLAWEAVRWILQRHPEHRDFARQLFRSEIAGSSNLAVEEEGGSRGVPTLGVLDEATRAGIRRSVLERIVRPCAAGLFAELEHPTAHSAHGRAEQ
jgi:hypothetical protein